MKEIMLKYWLIIKGFDEKNVNGRTFMKIV